ncbi:MAG: putative motility protein [Betaproteobacteria bacterium]|nr:putative motility protein [Betaproteobacteria bacterium]
MDLASVAGAVSTEQLAQVQGAAQLLALKKAMQIQAQSAMQLVQALSQPPAVQPGQPGGIINTLA